MCAATEGGPRHHRPVQRVHGQPHVRGHKVVGRPVPHARRLRPVEVHRLRAPQLDVHCNEEGSRGLVVPLALPPLPWEHHGVGGQALHHVGCQRDHVVAELHPMVCGHFSLSECLFFSIDPQKFIDGSTSSPGCSVINENPGLFKFWADPVKPWITIRGPIAAIWSRGKRNNLAVNFICLAQSRNRESRPLPSFATPFSWQCRKLGSRNVAQRTRRKANS